MAEKTAPESFDVTLSDILETNTGGYTPNCDQGFLMASASHLHAIIERHIPRATMGTLNGMLTDALELAGFNGKIIVERTQGQPHLEHLSGHAFKLPLAIQLQQRTFRNVRVICLDGHLESVADAHFLFEQIAESKQTVALFCREISDDVRHTIKVNFERGMMRVIPFIVTFDLEGANTLNDIAIIAGNDVVSRNQGSMISKIKLLDHNEIEQLDIGNGTVTLYNKATHGSVQTHIRMLQKKLSEMPDGTQQFIEQRLRSMISSAVIMRINDDANFIFCSQLIDFTLRSISLT